MKMNKKAIIILLSVIAATVLIVVVAVSIFKHVYPTYYPFKDSEIIGSTPEEIIEKYGEFSKDHYDEERQSGLVAYMIREKTDPSYDDSLWYEIHFKDGVAVSVRLQEGWYGG